MCKILLSINPQYAENILKGVKRYEFRKVRCRLDVNRMVIYSTAPVMAVVGEAEIISIIEDKPETVWELTADYSGIDKEFFDEYFRGRDNAIAYKLGKVEKYPEPLKLSDLGINFAPQSFVYLTGLTQKSAEP